MNGWKSDALQSALDSCDAGQDGLKGFDITTCFANAAKRANYGCTKNLDESSLVGSVRKIGCGRKRPDLQLMPDPAL